MDSDQINKLFICLEKRNVIRRKQSKKKNGCTYTFNDIQTHLTSDKELYPVTYVIVSSSFFTMQCRKFTVILMKENEEKLHSLTRVT